MQYERLAGAGPGGGWQRRVAALVAAEALALLAVCLWTVAYTWNFHVRMGFFRMVSPCSGAQSTDAPEIVEVASCWPGIVDPRGSAG